MQWVLKFWTLRWCVNVVVDIGINSERQFNHQLKWAADATNTKPSSHLLSHLKFGNHGMVVAIVAVFFCVDISHALPRTSIFVQHFIRVRISVCSTTVENVRINQWMCFVLGGGDQAYNGLFMWIANTVSSFINRQIIYTGNMGE